MEEPGACCPSVSLKAAIQTLSWGTKDFAQQLQTMFQSLEAKREKTGRNLGSWSENRLVLWI